MLTSQNKELLLEHTNQLMGFDWENALEDDKLELLFRNYLDFVKKHMSEEQTYMLQIAFQKRLITNNPKKSITEYVSELNTVLLEGEELK